MKNESGIHPIEYKVLIRATDVGDKIGNVFIPQESQERKQFAQMEGKLIAASPKAFSYEDWGDDRDALPKPGDRVLFAKYAGANVRGKDGVEYRLVNDKDIAALLR